MIRKEKIVQLVPEVYGNSAYLATNLFALTDVGNIWYKTTKGWMKETLPPELRPDEPHSPPIPMPDTVVSIGDKAFFSHLAEKLEKVGVAPEENEKKKE